jgi:hypothetical protein
VGACRGAGWSLQGALVAARRGAPAGASRGTPAVQEKGAHATVGGQGN